MDKQTNDFIISLKRHTETEQKTFYKRIKNF